MAFRCSLCSRGFKLRHQLERHLECVHVGEGKHVCDTCQRSFSREDNLRRHQLKHTVEENIFACEVCDRVFFRKDNLIRHVKTRSNEPPRKRQRIATPRPMADLEKEREPMNAPKLNPSKSDDYERIESGRPETEQRPTNLASTNIMDHQGAENTLTWREDPVRFPDSLTVPGDRGMALNCDAGDLQKLYIAHWADIRTKFHTRGKIRNSFNFRLQTMATDELITRARQIFDNQDTAIKINVGFGFILRNIETCQLQYYYASNNTKFLPEPALITNRESFDQVIDNLSSKDPIEHVRQARPNSKWVVEMITNAIFYVYKLRDHPIGGAPHRLPDFVINNKAIVTLQKDRNNGHRYEDNLCFFRCLALHRGGIVTSLEKKTKKLYANMYTLPVSEFKGIPLSKLQDAENLFKLNIAVYELAERKEDNELPDDIENNDELPGDIHPKTDEINQCGTPPTVVARLVRRSLEKYDDTMYLNICGDHFSYIKDIDIYTHSYQCRKCLKLWKHRGMLNRHETTCEGTGVTHKFPGGVYTHPKTVFELLEEEGIKIPFDLRYHPHRAVFDFESYFEKVSNTSSESSKLTWEAKHVPLSVSVCSNVRNYEEPVCFISDKNSDELLNQMLAYLTEISEQSSTILMETYAPYISEIESRIKAEQKDFDELCEKRKKHARPRQHHLQVLLDKLNAYLIELPVIGFNSGSYDLNLVKEYLFPWLVENDPLKFIVKRNNNYMSVKSKKLLFLDIVNFLAPGFSYDIFLKAYECDQQKGWFPYEWINFENLDFPELPPHSAFYSDLKKSNISENEYAECQRVWQEEGMTSMRDFLTWYNNRDVVPFLEALEKMTQFYRERKIDVFKDGISVPGLTMKYLFKEAKGEPFAIFGEKDKDLYYTFRQNLVGGPSIIFHRYQEKGKTFIRDTENVCQKVIGFDANALYLWAIMQEMPAGPFLRRREESGFKLEHSRPVSVEWLEWCARRDGVKIRHKGNDTEKRVGLRRIPVDGFCQETNTIYQFHGCYWHGHNCHLNANKFNSEKDRKVFETRRHNTDEIRNYIQSLGYNYEETWECEYTILKNKSAEVKRCIHSNQLPLERSSVLNPENIVRAIREDLMFGVIECDINVPDDLKPKFSEMCPIFKNAEISIDDIGEHMKSFALDGKILTKPRKSLIGSMFGEKILLATPLVKWYLEKGLKITRIYQFIEFAPKTCFKSFGEAVSDARRAGDKDPSKAIIADTMKLIGNSSYGKTITNKESHRNVNIVEEDKASRMINDIRFRDINEISTTCYEVESAKRSISMDLPLQIGFFVYQYAKLRMLQFYYDFLQRYFNRDYREYVEMDTDSAYITIAADNLEDLLKPEMAEAYYRDKHSWFPRDDTVEHKQHDKRTPGLFKVEWEGDGIVALNSKMYYCFGGDGKDKYSCKGVNKKRNDIRKDIYLDVLTTKTPHTGENKGFRVKDNQVFTYSQLKNGFTYFYPKRKVLENGVQTVPLDI